MWPVPARPGWGPGCWHVAVEPWPCWNGALGQGMWWGEFTFLCTSGEYVCVSHSWGTKLGGTKESLPFWTVSTLPLDPKWRVSLIFDLSLRNTQPAFWSERSSCDRMYYLFTVFHPLLALVIFLCRQNILSILLTLGLSCDWLGSMACWLHLSRRFQSHWKFLTTFLILPLHRETNLGN